MLSLLPGAQHLQNLHPLFVHFPLAFLYGAAALYFAGVILRRDTLLRGGFWMLIAGVLSAIPAIATGLFARGGVMLAPDVKNALLTPHLRLMISGSIVALLLAIWAAIRRPIPIRARYVFLFGLLVMIALLTKGADLGGLMVYDYNGGGAACPQPIPYSPNGSPAM
jgi:uncharacterized membrane protein